MNEPTIDQYQLRYDKILSYRGDGWSGKRIAKKLRITHQRVHQILKNGRPKPVRRGRRVPVIEKGRRYTRYLVRERDGFTCQDCGHVRTPEDCKRLNKRALDVHHLNGLCGKMSRGYDKVADMAGLVTLCHKCHYNRPEHAMKRKTLTKALSTAWVFILLHILLRIAKL